MNLLPKVKHIEFLGGYAKHHALMPYEGDIDPRLQRAIDSLDCAKDGLKVEFNVGDGDAQDYRLEIGEDCVKISSEGACGAFYAIQTLRQILREDNIPTLVIEDAPDFKYRGVYHDVTRGKVPKLETLKGLVDTLASYKINSLQLYVEHTYEFKECKSINEEKGYLTASEIRELDKYCKDRFIDFIPSISTFGHMYEILEIEDYKNLRVFPDLKPTSNKWLDRMDHHTINPTADGSIELVKSLIDQYSSNFTSKYFNICGDETFDLKVYAEKMGDSVNEARLYVDFVNKIVDHVRSGGKRVMMWGDILLRHPEVIEEIPEDTVFLNWDYAKEPNERNIEAFASLGRDQIVCPGTSTWNKLSENVSVAEGNIVKMAEYGYKHGAIGLLNTNWGDWGNACSLELSMYGVTLGAEKSWCATSKIDDEYYKRAGMAVYGDANGVSLIKRIDEMYTPGGWTGLLIAYCKDSHGEEYTPLSVSSEELARVQSAYKELTGEISASAVHPEIKEEMLTAVEGMCVMTELLASLSDNGIKRLTNTEAWVKKFSKLWERKNKTSELKRITDAFMYFEKS